LSKSRATATTARFCASTASQSELANEASPGGVLT
jgi:hypothetical protein